MLRRLSLLLLLLVPAPLAAQGFRAFTSPGGELWYLVDFAGSDNSAPLPYGEELWLLDATGARVKQLAAIGTDLNFWDLFIGNFAPGEQFGFEFASLQSGRSDRYPVTVGGHLQLQSAVDTGFGTATVGFSLYYPHGTITPEPMSIALLGTGLVGLGVVGWRKRRQGAV